MAKLTYEEACAAMQAGGVTMSTPLAETYARDPKLYSGTFCATCKEHKPVGANGEFTWVDDDSKVGT